VAAKSAFANTGPISTYQLVVRFYLYKVNLNVLSFLAMTVSLSIWVFYRATFHLFAVYDLLLVVLSKKFFQEYAIMNSKRFIASKKL